MGTRLGLPDTLTFMSPNSLSSYQRVLLWSYAEHLGPHVYLARFGLGGWGLNLRNCLIWTEDSSWRPFRGVLVMAKTSQSTTMIHPTLVSLWSPCLPISTCLSPLCQSSSFHKPHLHRRKARGSKIKMHPLSRSLHPKLPL